MWDPERPIKEMDDRISIYFASMANLLYRDLFSQTLKVELAEAPEQKHPNHKIRVVNESNPEWYKDLYSRYSHVRTYRSKKTNRERKCLESKLKRRTSLNALERINGFMDSYYDIDFIYRDFIFERLTEGYEEKGYKILPLEQVRKYFGKSPLEQDENLSYEDFVRNPLNGYEYKMPLPETMTGNNSSKEVRTKNFSIIIKTSAPF